MDTIKVSKRDFTQSAKKLRRAGMVPGSVFGGSLPEAISLQMEETVARKLVSTLRIGSRAELDLDGEIIPVQLKEKSVDKISNKINDISFQALKAGQKVHSVVDILLKNTDKLTDMLEHFTLEIPYAALPRDMIDTVTIDVDGMKAGTICTVADIKELQSDKIELLVSPETIVFRISEKTAYTEPEPEESSEEAESEE